MTRSQFVSTMYITSKNFNCTLYAVLFLSNAKERKKVNSFPANVTRITNDTEDSYTYELNGVRTDLSILVSAGSDPACISKAQYRDGIEKPLKEEMLHISSEEKKLLSKLLSESTIL